MSRPTISKHLRRKSKGITLSPLALKLGLKHARTEGVSLSEIINRQLLKLKP
jgi:hypothetical protein